MVIVLHLGILIDKWGEINSCECNHLEDLISSPNYAACHITELVLWLFKSGENLLNRV